MIYIKKSWLFTAIVIILAGCAAVVTTPELSCTCGNVSLRCTLGELEYVMPDADCTSSNPNETIQACVATDEFGKLCTSTELNSLEIPGIELPTPDPETQEETSPEYTCTFVPQDAPAEYEGDESALYCWECSDGTLGCSAAYREAYGGSNLPSQ